MPYIPEPKISRAFSSKYAGVCLVCELSYQVGDRLRYVNGVYPKPIHSSCVDAALDIYTLTTCVRDIADLERLMETTESD